jgi:hypothetical protein
LKNLHCQDIKHMGIQSHMADNKYYPMTLEKMYVKLTGKEAGFQRLWQNTLDGTCQHSAGVIFTVILIQSEKPYVWLSYSVLQFYSSLY